MAGDEAEVCGIRMKEVCPRCNDGTPVTSDVAGEKVLLCVPCARRWAASVEAVRYSVAATAKGMENPYALERVVDQLKEAYETMQAMKAQHAAARKSWTDEMARELGEARRFSIQLAAIWGVMGLILGFVFGGLVALKFQSDVAWQEELERTRIVWRG